MKEPVFEECSSYGEYLVRRAAWDRYLESNAEARAEVMAARELENMRFREELDRHTREEEEDDDDDDDDYFCHRRRR